MEAVTVPKRGLHLWATLLALWCSVIFAFSQMPGNGLPGEPPLWYVLERKSAHVFEYAVLLILAVRFFTVAFPSEARSRILILAATFAVSYGVLDELHQFFIYGRGARLTDVLVDAFGVILALVWLRFFRRRG